MNQGVIRNLNILYKPCLLGRVVPCFNSRKNYRADLLSSTSMLADVQKANTPNTHLNCFRHAGFQLDDEPATTAWDTVTDVPTDYTDDLIDELGDIYILLSLNLRRFKSS